MANVKDPNDIILGTGKVFVNGMDVGQIDGDISFNHKKEEYEKKSGFPQTTVLSILTGESLEGKFSLLEANLDTLRGLMPEYALQVENAGTATVAAEGIRGVSSARKSALANRGLGDSGFTAHLAAFLSTAATAGATVLNVESTAGFTAGDAVTLVNGATTETGTIAASGVNAGAKTLTLTAGIANAYPTGTVVKNTTVSLAEKTDYRIDPIDGAIWRVAAGAKLPEGASLVVGYTYATYSGRGFSAGGGSGTGATYLLEFWHKRRDGRYRLVRIYRTKIKGDFGMDFKETKESPVDLSIVGLADSTRPAGDQLYRVMDMEAAAAPGGGW